MVAAYDRSVGASALAETDVVILAGGLGTRLAEVWPGRPKILAPLAGEPILDRLLARLEQQGARRVILALGHLADQVCRHLDNRFDGLALLPSVEPEPLGTAGAVAHALPLLRSDHVVVLNGDSLIDADLADFVAWAIAEANDSALIATPIDRADRYGALLLAKGGAIEAFYEKQEEGAAWINAGVYWFGPLALNMIAALGRGSLEREILPRLPIGSICAYRSAASFIDIGTPESFARAARWPLEAMNRPKMSRA
jgi:NDP-sugar pyrophosphorylase family protein